jgi:uncharacterized membrane protein YidH (DUF202 family)
MPPTDDGPTDPGGAPERTRLSWRRTSLTATVSAILLVRFALQHHNRAVAITVSALTALLWVTLIVLIQRRVHDLPASLASARTLILATLGCLGLGVLGVVLIAV